MSSCATQPPPTSPDIRKQALPGVELDRPWRAVATSSTNGEPPTLQDDWLKTFQDSTLDSLVRESREEYERVREALRSEISAS